MENILHGDIREHHSKGDNHRLRSKGRIPGVVYGMKQASMLVEFAELDVSHVLDKIGEHGIVDLDINGRNQKSMIKEVQRDPVTRKIIHIDLQRVNENEKVRLSVPIVIKGEDIIRNMDLITQIQKNEVEVECTPDKLPKYITVDVSSMKPHQRLTVKDIEFSNEISILDEPDTIILSVNYIKDKTTEEKTPDEAAAVHAEDAAE